MKVFYEKDADLAVLSGKIVSVIGYGNQGRAQALNLRDSGLDVLVGNIEDDYADTARSDGFDTLSIKEATARGDIVMVLLPDEIQAAIYEQHIGPQMRRNQALSFASGYNVHFNLIRAPEQVDVIMVAPRTIGRQVRAAYLEGSGVNADVDVHQDATGKAWDVALALAKGIGSTRVGVFHTSFAVETELDLFSEQALWPAIFESLLTAYEVLIEKGYPKEAVALELYASAEPADIFLQMSRQGILEQLKFHSPTAQYGMLSHRKGSTGGTEQLRKTMENALEYIRNGSFAREWAKEQRDSYANLERLRKEAFQHAITEADKSVRELLGHT